MSRVHGVGLGFRWEIADDLLHDRPPEIDFLEVAPENYLGRGGRFRAALEEAASVYPVVTHGLTMSLGGHDPLDAAHLREVAAFVRTARSPWHSDHLCFGSSDGRVLHDLLPLTFDEETVRHVAARIRRVEDALGVPLAVENVSAYLRPGEDAMSEPEFVARVCEAADCKLLFDVNNAYVNARNFGYDLDAWLGAVPFDRVVQIHVAGHTFSADDGLLLDTHAEDVCPPVLAFLERVIARTGPVPVLLERDDEFPPLASLVDELRAIRALSDAGAGAPA
jgi:uncharacterized protein (UPF0276 family)